MLVKQLSVFLENKPGKLGEIINALAEKSINISALSLADTEEYGILRLIVDDTEKAASVLKEDGVIVKITKVLAVAIDDKPGGLSNILNTFFQNGINVEYMYAFVAKSTDRALMVVKVSDADSAENLLSKSGHKTDDAHEMYRL